MSVFVYYIRRKGISIMEYYRLQELQWMKDNGYVLTREEELLLIELTNRVNNLFEDWLDNNY